MPIPWHTHPLAAEMDVALAAVRRAGRLCQTVQAAIDPGALAKSDRSPVTVADFGSQALVCRALGEHFPDEPVIGEEDAAMLQAIEGRAALDRVTGLVRAEHPDATADDVCAWIDHGNAKDHSPRFWTLDPIDGTKGFLRGGQYAIALALVVDGQLALAVMGCPNLGPRLAGSREEGTLFAAVKDGGVWQMPLLADSLATSVGVSSEPDVPRFRFCESVEAAHSSHGDAARIASHLRITAGPVRLDSQAKYGVVARGEAEVYMRLPRGRAYREKIWDHAAGALVVAEAGGRVTDIHGRELDFGRGYELADNRGIIATSGRGHDDVLGAIAELGIGSP